MSKEGRKTQSKEIQLSNKKDDISEDIPKNTKYSLQHDQIDSESNNVKVREKQISTYKSNDKNSNEISLNERNHGNYLSEPSLEDNLFDIIYKLKHNTNMNILIKTINKILTSHQKKPFNEKEMLICLNSKELDKFHKKNTVDKNFSVEISYSLRED